MTRRLSYAVRHRARGILGNPSNDGERLRRAVHMVRFELACALGREAVIPFGERSRIYARKAGDSSSRPPLARLPDWPEMAVWQAWLKPGALFVDIGANVGLYTLLAAECGSEVIAVEPVNATAAALRRNLDLNGIAHGVHVVEVALLNRNGTAVLDGEDPNRQSARWSDDGGVPATTLDEVLGQRTALGVKVDVEGNERLVLEGATRALGAHRIGLMQLEWNHTSMLALGEGRAPAARLIRRAGYALVRVDASGRNLTVIGNDEAERAGRDVFAVPEERLEELVASLDSHC
jgi:FkbM family methyltransferase